MRVIFTGSRDWTDKNALFNRLGGLLQAALVAREKLVLVHGDGRGADQIADEWARAHGVEREVHPADWKRYGEGAGPKRNAEMVAAGADMCVAYPLPGSRGTKDCMERCRNAGIPVIDMGPGERR